MDKFATIVEALGSFVGQARRAYLIYRRWYRSKKFKIPHLVLFPVAFLWMELILKAYGKTGIFSHLLYTLIFSLSAGLFFAGVTSFFRKKINRKVSLVILWTSAFYFVVECMMKYTYQTYMSLDSMSGGAGNVFKEYMSELITAIIHGIPRFAIFALPAILYTCTGRRRMPARRMHRNFCGMLIIVSFILLGIGSLAGRFGKYGEIYKGGMAFDTMTEDFGLVTSTRLSFLHSLFGSSDSGEFDVSDSGSEKEAQGEDESEAAEEAVPAAPVNYGKNMMSSLDFNALSQSSDSTVASISTYVKSLTPSSQNAYTGLFKGKNLILICAEAFSDVVIDQELTPTLYRMTHNGIYFSEYYQPSWGGSTSTGEFSEIMGLIPVKAVKSMTATADCNNYFTIGNALQREKYWSAAFHAGNYSVYGRDKTHTNLGYGIYLGRGNGIEDINGNDSSDTVTMNTTLDYYIANQPFSVYYMTLSGHCIYQKDTKRTRTYYDQVKARYGDQYKETTLYYLCYQMELENALKQMIEKLEAAGIADDTVICITSDHYPYGLEKSSTFKTDEDYLADLYGYAFSNSWEKDRNSWILWSGCLENENKNMAVEVKTPTYSLDICPTLLNLFGIEYDSRLLVGRDVFSDQTPLVIWNNYSWATERGKYDASSGNFYPTAEYEGQDNSEYVASIKKIVKNKMNYSDQVLSSNYFGALFGEDTVTDNSQYVAQLNPNFVRPAAYGSETAASTETAAAAGAEGAGDAAEEEIPVEGEEGGEDAAG